MGYMERIVRKTELRSMIEKRDLTYREIDLILKKGNYSSILKIISNNYIVLGKDVLDQIINYKKLNRKPIPELIGNAYIIIISIMPFIILFLTVSLIYHS